ncbi:nitrile hydratase accessory protein [Sneathiella limimaris]|uniref:nitrile hydratase accessory protein n=1 Tax=Sneathiella limimaris TaxID=1964213 RepID=UPI00146C6D79|nr:nitrile hydratase accessory protein [Sneathiella limimaris]
MSEMDLALTDMPIPKDDNGPVFEEPWQAQAFAMTLQLKEQGHFTWSEWADLFGEEIRAATRQGRACGNQDYYLCWLAALEKLLVAKDFMTTDQQQTRKADWLQAHLETEHGKPIELKTVK